MAQRGFAVPCARSSYAESGSIAPIRRYGAEPRSRSATASRRSSHPQGRRAGAGRPAPRPPDGSVRKRTPMKPSSEPSERASGHGRRIGSGRAGRSFRATQGLDGRAEHERDRSRRRNSRLTGAPARADAAELDYEALVTPVRLVHRRRSVAAHLFQAEAGKALRRGAKRPHHPHLKGDEQHKQHRRDKPDPRSLSGGVHRALSSKPGRACSHETSRRVRLSSQLHQNTVSYCG